MYPTPVILRCSALSSPLLPYRITTPRRAGILRAPPFVRLPVLYRRSAILTAVGSTAGVLPPRCTPLPALPAAFAFDLPVRLFCVAVRLYLPRLRLTTLFSSLCRCVTAFHFSRLPAVRIRFLTLPFFLRAYVTPHLVPYAFRFFAHAQRWYASFTAYYLRRVRTRIDSLRITAFSVRGVAALPHTYAVRKRAYSPHYAHHVYLWFGTATLYTFSYS